MAELTIDTINRNAAIKLQIVGRARFVTKVVSYKGSPSVRTVSGTAAKAVLLALVVAEPGWNIATVADRAGLSEMAVYWALRALRGDGIVRSSPAGAKGKGHKLLRHTIEWERVLQLVPEGELAGLRRGGIPVEMSGDEAGSATSRLPKCKIVR